MKGMTAKQFLRQARDIDRRIKREQEQIERLRAKLEAGRMSSVTGMPRGGGADWTDTANKLIDLEKRMNARLREMCRVKQSVMDAIDRVEPVRARELLECYYLYGMTWAQTAEALHCNERHVYRLHGRALRLIEVPEGGEKRGERWH